MSDGIALTLALLVAAVAWHEIRAVGRHEELKRLINLLATFIGEDTRRDHESKGSH